MHILPFTPFFQINKKHISNQNGELRLSKSDSAYTVKKKSGKSERKKAELRNLQLYNETVFTKSKTPKLQPTKVVKKTETGI